ncbi:hypothetical protein ACJMK2_036443 [Sinanodonta woodiana]|uniref:Forkhead box protein N3 n=1 Tax=Sinanodonta woodiana TaxID=1069815 RepID=A0ABD3WH85_SINWO
MPSMDINESDASMRQRLVNSLSASFPGSALSKALQGMKDLDDGSDEMNDPLSKSCFAELRLIKEEPMDEEDDELTSLAWLQDSDLLKNIHAGEDGFDSDEGSKENGDIKMNGCYPQTHPPHVPYNPQKHIHSKPPYSFSCLIFMAVEDSPQKMLPVKDIYAWILNQFPYFQNAPTGWKNSVRHNLSLNKCFKKVEKDRGLSIGKGSLWCIDPEYRPNLLQALRKTPYHPYHQLQMLANPPPSQQYQNGQGINRPLPLAPRLGPNTVSPHLFPFLSKRLNQTSYDIDSDIQDVAQTLVSLKSLSNSKHFHESQDLKRKRGIPSYQTRHFEPIVCTVVPSEDHTYSMTTVDEDDLAPSSPSSSIDDEYDFGSDEEIDDFSDNGDRLGSDGEYESGVDEVDGYVPNNRTPKRPRLICEEDDEEEKKKIEEGADALLNLAGIFKTSQPLLSSRNPEHNSCSQKNSAKNSKRS